MHHAAARAVAHDSLPKIIRKIPKHCLERDTRRAVAYLVRDYVMAAALGAGILYAHTWSVGLPLSFLLGCVLTGLFVIGHDAGHRSFSYSERLNNVIGHVALSPLLWPFHVWRLSHDHHHRWTHHAEQEIAWKPLTLAEYQDLAPWKRCAYRLTRTSLFFLASTLFQYFYVKDAAEGVFFHSRDAQALKRSIRITALVGLAYIGGAVAAGGLYGLVLLFVVPQLVFQFWMSLFTFLHHTSPENKLMSADEWSPEVAQLTMSVQVFYPAVINWLTHDISWHVPHHVCVGVPHYHLREAHAALKQAYPQLVQEHAFSWSYLKRALDRCHLIGSTAPGDQEWYIAGPVPDTVTSASRI